MTYCSRGRTRIQRRVTKTLGLVVLGKEGMSFPRACPSFLLFTGFILVLGPINLASFTSLQSTELRGASCSPPRIPRGIIARLATSRQIRSASRCRKPQVWSAEKPILVTEVVTGGHVRGKGTYA
jgi:hypothetical protein